MARGAVDRCSGCGTGLHASDRFCRACGVPVAVNAPPVALPAARPVTRRRWRRRIALGTGGLLGVFVLLAVAGAALNPDDPDPTATPTDLAAQIARPTETAPESARTVTPAPPTATFRAARATPAGSTQRVAVAGDVLAPTAMASSAPTVPEGVPPGATQGRVVGVVDGDTVDVWDGSANFRVRLIGIDTPETKDPNDPVECFGAEATDRATGVLLNRTVYLEKDVSETDRFDRLLRYLWVVPKDGGAAYMANERLVEDGYAAASRFPPDVRYAERLRDAEAAARGAERGLWAACGGVDTPLEPPTPTPRPRPIDTPRPVPTATSVAAVLPPVVPQPPAGNCDPSYPNVCIPSSPPDLDCGDVPYRRFAVLPPDPHRFDREADGIGCESG